jgi:hypothetical protein
VLDQCPRQDLADVALAATGAAAEAFRFVYRTRLRARIVVAIGRQIRTRSAHASTSSRPPAVSKQATDDTRAHQALDIGLDLVDVQYLHWHPFNLLRRLATLSALQH